MGNSPAGQSANSATTAKEEAPENRTSFSCPSRRSDKASSKSSRSRLLVEAPQESSSGTSPQLLRTVIRTTDDSNSNSNSNSNEQNLSPASAAATTTAATTAATAAAAAEVTATKDDLISRQDSSASLATAAPATVAATATTAAGASAATAAGTTGAATATTEAVYSSSYSYSTKRDKRLSAAVALKAKAAEAENAKKRREELARKEFEEQEKERLRQEEIFLRQSQEQEFQQSLMMDQLKDLMAKQRSLSEEVKKLHQEAEEHQLSYQRASQRLERIGGGNPRLEEEARKASELLESVEAHLEKAVPELEELQNEIALKNEMLAAMTC